MISRRIYDSGNLLFLSLTILLTFFGCDTTKVTTSGPMEIHCEVKNTTSLTWFTKGKNPLERIPTSNFNIKYNGEPVTLPFEDEEDPGVWQALFLKDAPKTAVLAISQKIYLVHDAGRTPKVTLLSKTSLMKKYQFLDSENGQPGLAQDINKSDYSQTSRFLSGGRFLFVNSESILDIKTFQIHHIDLKSPRVLSQLHHYNPSDSPAVGMSPLKTQIVMVGSRVNPESNSREYALVAIDFHNNKSYAVPFDHTESHFSDLKNVTNQWITTHFDWTVSKTGEEILQPRKSSQPPSWKSRWGEYAQTGILEKSRSSSI